MPLVPTKSPLDGRCVYWCALLVLGFAYVSMVLCHRSTPFASDNNGWGDWFGLVLSGPTLSLVGTRHTLRGSGEGWGRAILWNGLGFGVPFFAALHWEWVGKLIHANYSLTAHQLSHLNKAGKIAFAVEIGITLAIATLCLREARREKILAPYVGTFIALVAVLVAITMAFGPAYHVHIHHYFLALCLLPFVRFRQPVCFVTQAVLAGMYVEGVCRWGLDPVWILSK